MEIAEALDTSISTIASNVKILEDAGLILTELYAATRGTKRVCSKNYADIFVNLDPRYPLFGEQQVYEVNMPVGHYIDCQAKPSCGLIGLGGTISSEDCPSVFFDPARVEAHHLWFRTGSVTYRFPSAPPGCMDLKMQSLEFSLELCSEAPNYEMDWPSDITFWVNDVEVATWTSPSDFGDRNGLLKSGLWSRKFFSQYGLLKHLYIDSNGTFIDQQKASSVTIQSLMTGMPAIDFKLGVKEDADNKGGVNIFGAGFGDHDQDIHMKVIYQL